MLGGRGEIQLGRLPGAWGATEGPGLPFEGTEERTEDAPW